MGAGGATQTPKPGALPAPLAPFWWGNRVSLLGTARAMLCQLQQSPPRLSCVVLAAPPHTHSPLTNGCGPRCFAPVPLRSVEPPFIGDTLAVAHVIHTLHRALWLMITPGEGGDVIGGDVRDVRHD
jgi:hypothetical protein